jgi:long-chain acyl-CoA synthetase
MNVSNIINRHVAEHPDKTAIIFGDRRISYGELDRLINRIAGGLFNLGLKGGDVVSLFLPSLPELIIGYLGSVWAGLTVNVANAMLREQEVAYILKDCSTRAIVVDHKRLPIVESVRSKVESLRRVILLGKSERDDYVTFNDLLEKVPVAVEFIKEVPRSASGKPLRRMLRDKKWG